MCFLHLRELIEWKCYLWFTLLLQILKIRIRGGSKMSLDCPLDHTEKNREVRGRLEGVSKILRCTGVSKLRCTGISKSQGHLENFEVRRCLKFETYRHLIGISEASQRHLENFETSRHLVSEMPGYLIESTGCLRSISKIMRCTDVSKLRHPSVS